MIRQSCLQLGDKTVLQGSRFGKLLKSETAKPPRNPQERKDTPKLPVFPVHACFVSTIRPTHTHTHTHTVYFSRKETHTNTLFITGKPCKETLAPEPRTSLFRGETMQLSPSPREPLKGALRGSDPLRDLVFQDCLPKGKTAAEALGLWGVPLDDKKFLGNERVCRCTYIYIYIHVYNSIYIWYMYIYIYIYIHV